MALSSAELFGGLEEYDNNKHHQSRQEQESYSALCALLANSSDEDEQGSCIGTTPSYSEIVPLCTESGRKKSAALQVSKTAGKFKDVRMHKVASSNGKMKNVADGQDARVVPMDEVRMQKIMTLMRKHNNFDHSVDMNDINVMVDHFTVLMILNQAYTKNGQGSGDKYPRYLRIFFLEGCFSKHEDIVPANRERAIEIATLHVRKNVIHSQNIKIAGQKVSVMSAPEKKRTSLINKLVNNFMFGFNVYAGLLADVASGKLKLPNPNAQAWAVSGFVIATAHPFADPAADDDKASRKRHRTLCDPDSPCASGNED